MGEKRYAAEKGTGDDIHAESGDDMSQKPNVNKVSKKV